MLRPARMVQLNVLVMDSDVDRATTQMIESGLVHLVSVTDIEPWTEESGLQAVAEHDSHVVKQVEITARSIAEKLRVGPETVVEPSALEPFHPEEASKILQQISGEVNSVVAARDVAAQELATLQEGRSRAMRDFREMLGAALPSRHTLLELVIGRLPGKNVDPLKRLLSEVPNVVLTFGEEGEKVPVMAIVLKRNRDVLLRAIEEVGLERIPAEERKPGLPYEVMEHLEERIQKAQEELQRAEAAVARCRAAHLSALRTILSQVALHNLTRLARGRFRKTARTYLISGWTPRQSRHEVVEGLKKACGNRCLIEEQTAGQVLSQRGRNVDVPILFSNPRVLKPFEMLVSTYGQPAYDSVDPTMIVAPTFLLMYGVMFGDVGQGALIALLGALVAKCKKVSEGIRRIAELFVWCGCSAALFGFVYGSFFGFKDIVPSLGFEPMQRVDDFILIALFFGIGMISLGMLFNAIAAIAKKDWAAALLDRTGLMGLAFYWLAVAAVIQVFKAGSLNNRLIGILILLPVVATFLKGPVNKLIHPRLPLFGDGIRGYVLRSAGGILGTYFESVLMFLSNTVSFLRLAAFAIAHGALFIAVFAIADLVKGAGAGVPIFIHIFGNAGIIALEGLVVCVQSLRLEYYEFFGKFFQAGGTEFRPMRLPKTVL